MKTAVVISIAVALGWVIAFWLFALAFNMNTRQFYYAAVVPLFVCFVGSLILITVHPASMKWSAFGIMGPTVVINWYFFFAVWSEGRGTDWTHVTTAFGVIVAVIVGGTCGFLISRLIQIKRGD